MLESIDVTTAEAAAQPQVAAAFEAIAAMDAETLADMRAVTAIPAPLRGEAARAAWIAERFAQLGLPRIRTDAVGNVLAGAAGDDVGASFLLAAHLDTVFPGDTDLRLRERDGRLCAPGISDNGRGLAALLRLAAVLAHSPLLRRPVLFAATVGEEGAGDLRGVKHLFHDCGVRPAAFIAVDGAGMHRVVHRAVGSRRLRVRIDGPGGHSWSDRERPNPVHALAAAVAELESLRRTLGRDVAINVGRIGGGTSVNALPESAWLELDLRSEAAEAVEQLEQEARATFTRVATPPLRLDLGIMGDRPGGCTDPAHALVRAASAATAHFGVTPRLVSSSTDANVPMALGVPAIALGAGGEASGTHTVDEWYENERGVAGIQRLLLTLVLADALL